MSVSMNVPIGLGKTRRTDDSACKHCGWNFRHLGILFYGVFLSVTL